MVKDEDATNVGCITLDGRVRSMHAHPYGPPSLGLYGPCDHSPPQFLFTRGYVQLGWAVLQFYYRVIHKVRHMGCVDFDSVVPS